MIVRRLQPLLVGALAPVALLAGCGHSPPTRFFTLVPTPPGAAGADAAGAGLSTAGGALPAVVQLTAVHAPAALDRPQMVQEGRGGELTITDQDQWGAPLGELMRRDLAEDLLARLPRGAFVIPGAPRPRGAAALVVTVLDVRDRDGGVELSADWSLVPAGSRTPSLSRLETVRAGAALDAGRGRGGEALAEGLSRALGELSDHIAASLASAPPAAFAPAGGADARAGASTRPAGSGRPGSGV